MYNFDYVKPTSVAEAVSALSAEDAQPVSGGQTLIPTLKQRLAAPSKLVDLTAVAELKGIEVSGDSILIKGATPHAMVANSADVQAKIPALAHLAGHIGDPQVRNRGTIGGSVANDDPSACYPAAVLGLGATVITNSREIAADDFFLGLFTTALEEGEIVTGVRFPVPEKANYQKFVQPASRFALTGVFVAKTAAGPRVAVTGASEGGVFRWSAAEQALASDWSAAAVEAVAAPSADGMMSDVHGSAAYRAHLVKVLTKRAVAAA
jgi:carbon-monoxide dehydrogenase medium subunit